MNMLAGYTPHVSLQRHATTRKGDQCRTRHRHTTLMKKVSIGTLGVLLTAGLLIASPTASYATDPPETTPPETTPPAVAPPTFTPDRYPLLWWSECRRNGGDGVITWRTNSRSLRVPMVRKIFADLSARMPNYRFQQTSWYNKRAQITVQFSTRLTNRGWAALYGRRYSKFGDIRKVHTVSPFRAQSDSVVEYILRHEIWHAMGIRHQTAYGLSLMNPYYGGGSIQKYEQGQIPVPQDYDYAAWVNNNCTISQNVARSKNHTTKKPKKTLLEKDTLKKKSRRADQDILR